MTYDMRQDQDSINPCTHPDIMMLSSEDEGLPDGTAPHPYLYVWVIGIYHAEVQHESPHAPTSMPQVREENKWWVLFQPIAQQAAPLVTIFSLQTISHE